MGNSRPAAAVPAADRVEHRAAPAGAAGPGGRTEAMNERGRREFRDGVAALVGARFGGSYRAAFEHYDRNGAGRIDWEGLITLLADAAVGTRGTRPRWWTAAVMVELDRDGDGCLSWAEFAAVFGESPEPDRPEAATRVDGPRGVGR
jgi:hypothetical protein